MAELDAQLGALVAEKPAAAESSLAIGHTRWATHGEPTESNAHPHLSPNGKFAIAHNGIIENYLAIRSRLIEKGHEFKSDTDSETIAHLVEEAYDGDLQKAVVTALKQVEGTYGVIVISSSMILFKEEIGWFQWIGFALIVGGVICVTR